MLKSRDHALAYLMGRYLDAYRDEVLGGAPC